MSHRLSYKYDRTETQKIRTIPFPTLEAALAEACKARSDKTGWDFEISDEKGVVMDDAQIQDACGAA